MGHSVSMQVGESLPRVPRAVQKGRPARPQRGKRRVVPLGYVEGLNDARTTLAGFFNSLC